MKTLIADPARTAATIDAPEGATAHDKIAGTGAMPGTARKLLYRGSGAAALIVGLLLLVSMVSLVLVTSGVLSGTPGAAGPAGAAGAEGHWVTSVQNNWLVLLFQVNADLNGVQFDLLRGPDVLDIVIMALVALVLLGLYAAWRSTGRIWSLMALVALCQPFLGIGLFLVTGMVGRSAVMGGVLVMSCVMLRSRVFGRVTALVGIVASLLLLVGDFGTTPGSHSSMLAASLGTGYVLLTAWFLLVAPKLFHMPGRAEPVVHTQDTPSVLPLRGDLRLARRLSLIVAALTAAASAGGLLLGLGLGFGSSGLYGPDATRALGATEAEAGLLVPGLLGQDVFNLIVGVPLLLGSMWLVRRGSLMGLLLWPGVLFYALYWYLLYLVGAPFSALFLLYVPLVTLSAYALIALVSGIDGEQIRQRFAGLGGVRDVRRVGGASRVLARIAGAILVGLALLTLAQDASGALMTATTKMAALTGAAPLDPVARHVWIADLVLNAPAVLVGGVLLWRRSPLGYVAGAGLLLQYGLTPLGLIMGMALKAVLTATPLDLGTSAALLVFALVCFATLTFFLHGATRRERLVDLPFAGSRDHP